MVNDSVVVDAVVHPYNLSEANRDPAAEAQIEAVYKAHLSHPTPKLDAFADYLLPADLVVEFGSPQLTEHGKPRQ